MKTQTKSTIWTRIEGAGNSFWVSHFLLKPFKGEEETYWPKQARSLCQSSNPADGLAAIVPSKKADFKWLFYNADGSKAEMCGNAACCVTDYAFKKKLISPSQKSLSFETLAEVVRGDLKEGVARIFVKEKTDITGPFKEEINGEEFTYMFIDSGVPHAVIYQSLQSEKQWKYKKKLAQILRKQTKHHQGGMNISFYFAQKDTLLKARTYERGVEDFTPACGTGALAVAYIHRKNHPYLSEVSVQMPGGELKIEFHSDKTTSLISPVKWTQEMEIKNDLSD